MQMHGSRSCLHALAAAAARALADEQRLNVRQHLQRQETEQTQPLWWQLHGRQPQRRLAHSSYAGPCSSQAALARHEKEQRARCRTLSSRTTFIVRTLSYEGVRLCKACTNLVDGRVGRRRRQPAGLSALGGALRRRRGGEGARAGARRRRHRRARRHQLAPEGLRTQHACAEQLQDVRAGRRHKSGDVQSVRLFTGSSIHMQERSRGHGCKEQQAKAKSLQKECAPPSAAV